MATTPPVLTDKDIYEESGRNYRYFLDWRNKIIAGYLTGLAALAVAFFHAPSGGLHLGILGAAVILSITFRVLDFRNREFFTVCQLACTELEKKIGGSHSRLEDLRPQESSEGYSLITHGMAINILVASVIAGSFGIALHRDLFTSERKTAVIACIVGAIVLTIVMEAIGAVQGSATLRKKQTPSA